MAEQAAKDLKRQALDDKKAKTLEKKRLPSTSSKPIAKKARKKSFVSSIECYNCFNDKVTKRWQTCEGSKCQNWCCEDCLPEEFKNDSVQSKDEYLCTECL